MKVIKLLVVYCLFTGITSYSYAEEVKFKMVFKMNFLVNVVFAGTPQNNQDMMYDVQDDSGKVIIPMTHIINVNNTSFKFSYLVDDFARHKGVVSNNKYSINFYNTETKLPNSTKVSTRIPIVVSVSPEDLSADAWNQGWIARNCHHEYHLRVYGGIKYSIQAPEITGLDVKDDKGNKFFKTFADREGYVWCQRSEEYKDQVVEDNVTININIPYTQNYVPLKNPDLNITKQYTFMSN